MKAYRVPIDSHGPIISHLQDFRYSNGVTQMVRQDDDGNVVIDLHHGQFVSLLMGQNGKLWQDANPDDRRGS